MIYPNYVESLERRQLLAGVTLVFPAFDGGLTGWVDSTVSAITSELGGPQNVPAYTLTIAPNSDGTLAVQGVTQTSGTATPQANNPGQILVIVDYTSVSANPAYPASATADLVANFMENDPVDGVTWADLPIHIISTSIGTAVTDSLAQNLDESGIWVDQETYLDPHPDPGDGFDDPPNTVYDNVEFSDDYWRTDGQSDSEYPNGAAIDGSYSLELPWVESDYSGFAIAHLAPPAYYIGTIDPSLIGQSDGDGPIHSDWYGSGSTPTTFPSATQTGFLYSNIDGGTRPASGLWAASGGTGVRSTVTHTGLQWPNVSDIDPSASTAASGGTLDINFIHEDQSEADSVTFYLDSDQNPYDGATYKLGTQTGLASSTSIASGSYDASLKGVAPGTYYVVARATDSSGLQRYDYSIEKVVVTAAASAISVTNAAHSNPRVVTGTGTHLIAAATDADNGSDLTYTWTFTHLPSGAHTPAIKKNGTNAAQDVSISFYKEGGYDFTVTISNGKGVTTTSSGSVDVVQTATKLEVAPLGATIPKGHARKFSTVVIDQFGRAFETEPTAEYSIVSGPATIGSLNGIFTAGGTTGTALIKVEDDGLSDIVDASVVN
jgi:hypothetical protein